MPRSVYIAHDADFESHGTDLAAELGFVATSIVEAPRGSLSGEVDVIIDANLRDLATVEALKRAFGTSRIAGERMFLVEDGAASRLCRIQAGALGATCIVSRDSALTDLRKLLSVAGAGQPPPEKLAALAVAKGGASIVKAGEALAGAFSGLVAGQTIPMQLISEASSSVLAGVAEAGIDTWMTNVRAHHEGTFQHCLLVTGTAASYAKEAALARPQAIALMNAAMLHDVGKAIVPLAILDKADRLTDEEMDVIKRHPGAGFDYLSQHASMPAAILEAVRHHQEALDGSGYPDGLRGDAIMPLTRILTVCDVFAALVESRPYKETRTAAQAVSILIDMAISSKVDYRMVRTLAASMQVPAPERLEDVVRALTRPQRRTA